jgi:prepilin-type N-terminal cleavage/methylation domain-containing protein
MESMNSVAQLQSGRFSVSRHCNSRAFSLVEIMVAMIVLALLCLITAQIFKGAATITTITHSRIDDDNQARPILDRMAIDFAQMIKRGDVDFFGKNTTAPNSVGGAMGSPGNTPGVNDQMAFFSAVQGYYPSTGSPSPISLIAYRINTKNQLERMAKGLLWNGVSSTSIPMVFFPLTIAANWPTATNSSADADYEVIGPNVFRFEYYYQLSYYNNSRGYSNSDTPWNDTNDFSPPHSTVNGLRDVGWIVAAIATIDPQSRVLLTDAQLATLSGKLQDYRTYAAPGNSGKVGAQIQGKWEDALETEIQSSSSTLPKPALKGVRFYERYISLNLPQH